MWTLCYHVLCGGVMWTLCCHVLCGGVMWTLCYHVLCGGVMWTPCCHVLCGDVMWTLCYHVLWCHVDAVLSLFVCQLSVTLMMVTHTLTFPVLGQLNVCVVIFHLAWTLVILYVDIVRCVCSCWQIDFVAHDDVPYTTGSANDVYKFVKERGMYVLSCSVFCVRPGYVEL